MENAQNRTRSRYGLWASFLASGVLTLSMVGAAAGHQDPGALQSSGESPLDLPLRLISQARASYDGIEDYACLFVKRERLHNQLQPENLVAMRVRTRPFSVDLQWLKPSDTTGQEACYVAGRNAGQMRVRSAGLLGSVGFVSLDTNDPRVLENSRHSIKEAGIGNVISRFGEGWTMERSVNKTRVQVADYDYNKRHCVRVETFHPDNSDRVFLFYRSVVYFDRENHLPIRVENYDWPKKPGDFAGELVESYSYADLKTNIRLKDEVFNR
ncbi:MAG TPA: DUF1571 domain-containing protein [Gemmataceae bacterium]|nr:DUF1571 domain-containing protein [Gemmataceae bacterium]